MRDPMRVDVIMGRQVIPIGKYGDGSFPDTFSPVVRGGRFGGACFQRNQYPTVLGGRFGTSCFMESREAYVNGGRFAGYDFEKSIGAYVVGGEFGDFAFREAVRPVIKGGKFNNWALWKSKNPIVLGGTFQERALGYAEDAIIFLPEGGFESLVPPKSGIVVVDHIKKSIQHRDYKPEAKIFAVDCPDLPYVRRIDKQQMDELQRKFKENFEEDDLKEDEDSSGLPIETRISIGLEDALAELGLLVKA